MSASSERDAGRKARQRWMGLMARAPLALLEELAQPVQGLSTMRPLRAPETGLALIRAEAGAGGTEFHLGEVTVTRCALIAADGTIGHAYVTGRSHRHAWLAAALDALLQHEDRRAAILAQVIEPLHKAEAARHAEIARRAGETKVEFFTMVRESAA